MKVVLMKRYFRLLALVACFLLLGTSEVLASYPKACLAADKNDECRSHRGITVYDAYYGGTNYVMHREDWFEFMGRDNFYNMLNYAEQEGKIEVQKMADGCVDKVLVLP